MCPHCDRPVKSLALLTKSLRFRRLSAIVLLIGDLLTELILLKRPFHLNVSTRGVIYILVPALIQLFCLSMLVFLVDEENQVGQHDAHNKEVTARANWICVDISTALAARLACLQSGSDSAKKLFENAIVDLNNGFHNLKRAVKDEPAQVNLVEQAKQTADKLQQSMSEDSTVPAMAQMNQIISAAEQTLPELMLQRRALVRGDNMLESNVHKTPLQERRAVKDWITALMLITVVSALVAVYRFGKTIARRIAITSQNTERLSKGEPLLDPISGVDEIAQLDQSFHAMADALAQAQQARKEYVSMISHDIRTPLTSVWGAIEFLESGYGGQLSSEGNAAILRASRNLDRVLSMINSMLDIERLESGVSEIHLSAIDLKSVVAASIDSVRDIADKQHVEIVSLVPETQVMIDDERTTQVLVNLLGNALKFSPENTKIEVSSVQQGDEIEVRVKDQGRGIPAEALDKVFRRFQQVDERDRKKGSGVGLGLAICKAIVRAQGGTIGVTSGPGEGCTFWFTVKRAAKNSPKRS